MARSEAVDLLGLNISGEDKGYRWLMSLEFNHVVGVFENKNVSEVDAESKQTIIKLQEHGSSSSATYSSSLSVAEVLTVLRENDNCMPIELDNKGVSVYRSPLPPPLNLPCHGNV